LSTGGAVVDGLDCGHQVLTVSHRGDDVHVHCPGDFVDREMVARIGHRDDQGSVSLKHRQRELAVGELLGDLVAHRRIGLLF
jgi:hypothetical protein